MAELEIEDQIVGDGEEAVAGQTVEVHYTGWLTDGTKFDSSHDRDQTFSFKLGGGQVIAGWDQGVAGMKIGGTRKLTIPSDLGYGERGAGGVIPPNATLVFKVELMGLSQVFPTLSGIKYEGRGGFVALAFLLGFGVFDIYDFCLFRHCGSRPTGE